MALWSGYGVSLHHSNSLRFSFPFSLYPAACILPSFWDNLSRQIRVPRALKEFDRRTIKHHPPIPPQPPSLRSRRNHRDLKCFAWLGGPSLVELRGVSFTRHLSQYLFNFWTSITAQWVQTQKIEVGPQVRGIWQKLGWMLLWMCILSTTGFLYPTVI